MSRPAHTRERPTYPDLKAEFGEDPARFLYADLDPWPRLKTITDPELLRAYTRVEANRDDPRAALIGQLNCRIDRLTSELAPRVAADGGAQG